MLSNSSIIALLKTALLLLSLAQGQNVPQALHDQAVSVANQAITAATAAISARTTSSFTPEIVSTGNVTIPAIPSSASPTTSLPSQTTNPSTPIPTPTAAIVLPPAGL